MSNQNNITVTRVTIAACVISGTPEGQTEPATVTNIQMLLTTDDNKIIYISELANNGDVRNLEVLTLLGAAEGKGFEKIPVLGANIMGESDFGKLVYCEGINTHTEQYGGKGLTYLTFDTMNDLLVGKNGVDNVKYYVLHTQEVPQNGINFANTDGFEINDDKGALEALNDNLRAVIKGNIEFADA